MRMKGLLVGGVLLGLSTAAFAIGRATGPEPGRASSPEMRTPAGDQAKGLPAGAADAKERLAKSPRHGEWAVIRSGQDSIRAWVVYPERSTKAPVVLVVHEIFGMSNWIRAVADQMAAEGYIAIAPDLLTMKNVPWTADGEVDGQAATLAIRAITPEIFNQYLIDVAKYGMSLPAALPKYGIVGFCWGGSASFSHAVFAPDVSASVVYYGTAPDAMALRPVMEKCMAQASTRDRRRASPRLTARWWTRRRSCARASRP